MIWRALLLVVPLTAALGAARAQDRAIARIDSLLARPDLLCGRFEQSKTVAGLRRPVKSSGRFCVAAGHGVLWSTREPFPSRLQLTRDEIIEMQGDRVARRLSASTEPAVRMINETLFSVLTGSLSKLTPAFTADATAEGAEWHARLLPRDPGVRQAIASIDVAGGAFVRHVTFHDGSGDVTDIAFSDIVTGPAAAQPDEARLLGIDTQKRPPPPGSDAR